MIGNQAFVAVERSAATHGVTEPVVEGANAGAGHVRDARRLAKRQGWSSNRWFDNVEKAMLLLSKNNYAKDAPHGYVRGSEPVKYVREIRDRYLAYLKLTEKRK